METTTMAEPSEIAQDLADIKAEMLELLDQAESLLADADHATRARAKSYWFAHIRMALDDDHYFAGGGSAVTMQDTIDAIRREG